MGIRAVWLFKNTKQKCTLVLNVLIVRLWAHFKLCYKAIFLLPVLHSLRFWSVCFAKKKEEEKK